MNKIISIPIKKFRCPQEWTISMNISKISELVSVYVESELIWSIESVPKYYIGKYITYTLELDTYVKNFRHSTISKSLYVSRHIQQFILYMKLDTKYFINNTVTGMVIKAIIKKYASMAYILKVFDSEYINFNKRNNCSEGTFIAKSEKKKEFLISEFSDETHILDDDYVMINGQIRQIYNNKKRFFTYGGGIITNCGIDIISHYFDTDPYTLLVVPKMFSNIWDKSVVISYEDLENTKLEERLAGTWKRVVFFELDCQCRELAKYILSVCKPANLWLLYIGELHMYGADPISDEKFTTNDRNLSRSFVMSILNLFMNLSFNEKILMKKYLEAYINIKLSNITFCSQSDTYIHNYAIHKNIQTVQIKLDDIETNIFDQVNNFINKKLTILHNKSYLEFDTIFPKIITTIFNIFASREINTKNITDRHVNKIRNEISVYNKLGEHLSTHNKKLLAYSNTVMPALDRDIMFHLNSLAKLKNNGSKYMNIITDGINKLSNIKNRGTTIDQVCAICYSELFESSSSIYTLCGHSFCTDCYIGTMLTRNGCPICNYYINSRKVILCANKESEFSKIYHILNNPAEDEITFTTINIFTNNDRILFTDSDIIRSIKRIDLSRIKQINVFSNPNNNSIINNYLFFIAANNNIIIKFFYLDKM